MKEQLRNQLLADIGNLRLLVGNASSETICLKVFLLLVDPRETVRQYGLLAPLRQLQYLLGLVLTTPEPRRSSALTDSQWQRAFEHLKAIYGAYALMYWPSDEEKDLVKTEQWYKPRSVAMPAFLNYFSQGSMASIEQVVDRIRATLVPFDMEIADRTGVSATDVVEITKWLSADVQGRLDKLTAFYQFAKKHLDKAINAGWDEETARKDAQASPEYLAHQENLGDQRSPLSVSLTDLCATFGDARANAYWALFTSRRQSGGSFTYPTEQNPAVERPLIEYRDGTALMVTSNTLYEAILTGLARVLTEDSGIRLRYLQRRDKALERRVSGLLERLFPDADHYPECYEQADSRFEHDHVVIWQRFMFVFESKASPPPEPFRDPDKAYERIRRAFRSDTGIQAAFNQSNRLRRAHVGGDSIRLYDRRGKLLREVRAADLDRVYCVCVTSNSYGPVAVDLGMLLEKDDRDLYPWAVYVNDLDATVGAFLRKGWGPAQFREFLEQRQRLQGKAIADDELEIVGAFVLYGTLDPWIARREKKLFFLDGFSQVFDAIYEEQRGGPAPELEATAPPRFHDPHAIFSTAREAPLTERPIPAGTHRRRVGRNDPCTCGSGRKYKRCCMRKPH
jgi:SEC-C motif